MSPRQRVPIPFGAGLERHSGPMVADPTSQEDVRNVRLTDGLAHVRLGSAPGETFDEEHVVAGAPFQATGGSVLVAYHEGTREVRVYRADADTLNPVLVGVWFTLHADAVAPPNVWVAEVDGLMFFAHDEDVIFRRAPTVALGTVSDTLTPIEADWAHTDGIRFRGIESLGGNYLVGWGYGTEDSFRPEYIRISKPLEPSTFTIQGSLPAGATGAPVLRVIALSGTEMVVLKPHQTFLHVGGDRATFDIFEIDKVNGVLSSRLAVLAEDGWCYVWATKGPLRIGRGGPIEALDIPLDLLAPAPADLVAAGASAFAAYEPVEKCVLFHFGRRVFCYGIQTGHWSYRELAFEPRTAFLLDLSAQAVAGLPPGTASALSVTEDAEEGGGLLRDVTIEHTNNSMAGDEVLEYWVQPSGGAWAMEDDIGVAGATQQNTLKLDYGRAYKVQIRARRGSFYAPGYESADPDEWPVASLLEYTTALEAPVITDTEWERAGAAAEEIRVTVAPHYDDLAIELVRSAAVQDTVPGPHVGSVVLTDATVAGEVLHTFTARQVGADATSPESAPAEQWAGPTAPEITGFSSVTACIYTVEWTNGDVAAATEVWDDYPDTTFTLQETAAPAATSQEVAHGGPGVTCEPPAALIGVGVRIRHKLTSHGVDDFSQYHQDNSLELCDDCS